MKKLFAIAIVVLFVAPAAYADFYSWENYGTTLGGYGNICCETNVSGVQNGSQGSVAGPYTCPGPVSGDRYLHVAEDPHSGTPQAYLAWIINLLPGDQVYAGFYGYDITPGASPSWRIWAHYTDSADVMSYYGSAGGNSAYTAGAGWDYTDFTWTFAPSDSLATGMVIEGRLYSTPSTSNPDHTDYWADDITVTAPPNATVIFPEGGTAVEDITWGRIKGLYR